MKKLFIVMGAIFVLLSFTGCQSTQSNEGTVISIVDSQQVEGYKEVSNQISGDKVVVNVVLEKEFTKDELIAITQERYKYPNAEVNFYKSATETNSGSFTVAQIQIKDGKLNYINK